MSYPIFLENQRLMNFVKTGIDESKFNYKQIENLYFFPSNRWDKA